MDNKIEKNFINNVKNLETELNLLKERKRVLDNDINKKTYNLENDWTNSF